MVDPIGALSAWQQACCRLPLLALLIGAPFAAHASVYDVDNTDTATTIELKSKFYFTRTRDNWAWRLPGVDIVGPLGKDLEWSIGGGYGTRRAGDGPAHGGLRDVSTSVKWRVLDHSAEGGISMSIEPTLTFPVGSRSAGIGSGAVGFELPLVVAKRLGQFRLTGQARVERSFGRDDDAVETGILTEYLASDRWSLGIEFVAEAPLRHLGARNLLGDVGFKWEPNSRFELQMLAGRSLNEHDGGLETRARLMLEYHL